MIYFWSLRDGAIIRRSLIKSSDLPQYCVLFQFLIDSIFAQVSRGFIEGCIFFQGGSVIAYGT